MGTDDGNLSRVLMELQDVFREYQKLLSDVDLSPGAMRKDLKHMTFWQVYCAVVVEAVADGNAPPLVSGTYVVINKQAQIDYDTYTNVELQQQMKRSLRRFTEALKRIPPSTVIPYKKQVRGYTPSEFAQVMAGHYRMHVRHLKRLLSLPGGYSNADVLM